MTDKQLIERLRKLLKAETHEQVETAVSTLIQQAQALPPLVMTVAIDRKSGRLALCSSAEADADLAMLREAQRIAGKRIEDERLALARQQKEQDA